MQTHYDQDYDESFGGVSAQVEAKVSVGDGEHGLGE